MLTITIPTYNRNEILARQVRRLIPQLTTRCKLLIVDNHSDVPVEETLRPLWEEFPDVSYEVVRNKQNIGLSGNLLRCFELCETQYLWILGDDDPVTPDAVQTILSEVDSHPECFYFNFSFDGGRTKTFTTTGLEELVEDLDDSANVMWISTAVYRIEAMRPSLKFGYQYAFSILPHVAMLLVSVGKQGKCCFSDHSLIVLEEAVTTPIEKQWSRVNFALGMPTLYDLPMPFPLREKLSRKLLSNRWAAGLDLRFVTHQLLLEYLKYGDHRSTLYYFDQICARGYYLNSSLKSRAEVRFCRALLLWPRLTAVVYFLLKRKRISSLPLQHRQARL